MGWVPCWKEKIKLIKFKSSRLKRVFNTLNTVHVSTSPIER